MSFSFKNWTNVLLYVVNNLTIGVQDIKKLCLLFRCELDEISIDRVGV